MNFGEIIERLKVGKKVSRQGWNGKGMQLMLVDNWTIDSKYVQSIKNIPVLPFIAMKTADNHLVPWLASQTDVLAEDWVVVE